MPITLRGIYHNLKESEYTVSDGDAVFFFSSKLYMLKFLQEYETHRIEFEGKLNRVHNVEYFNVSTLADIALYNKIEKRGFHVWVRKLEVNQENLHLFGLRKMMSKHITKWCETQKLK